MSRTTTPSTPIELGNRSDVVSRGVRASLTRYEFPRGALSLLSNVCCDRGSCYLVEHHARVPCHLVPNFQASPLQQLYRAILIIKHPLHTSLLVCCSFISIIRHVACTFAMNLGGKFLSRKKNLHCIIHMIIGLPSNSAAFRS